MSYLKSNNCIGSRNLLIIKSCFARQIVAESSRTGRSLGVLHVTFGKSAKNILV